MKQVRKIRRRGKGRLVKKRFLLPSLLALLHFSPHVDMEYARQILEQKEEERFAEGYAPVLHSHIQSVNSRLTLQERDSLVRAILTRSRELRIPSHFRMDDEPVNPVYFLTALIQVESTFYRFAVSRSYARGYMQLKHPTVKWLDQKLEHPPSSTYLFYGQANLRLGVSYLNILFEEMGDLRKATLAYNSGATAVTKGRFDESYWEKIQDAYRELDATFHRLHQESEGEPALPYAPPRTIVSMNLTPSSCTY